MEVLYKILFAFLGYVILTIPHLIGLFIYPIWLILICGILSSLWVGPWAYMKYIQYKLKNNNHLRRK